MKTAKSFKRKNPDKQKNNLDPNKVNECKNCGNTFQGNYCPHCGQSTKEFDRPFSILIYDFMGTMFAFDTRFIKTLIALIISPGHYSSEFVKGKRATYMQPFKFYVFVSFVFFLLLHLKTREFISANSDNLNPAFISTPLSAKDSTGVDTTTAAIQVNLSKEKTEPAHKVQNGVVLNKTERNKILDTTDIKNLKKALSMATNSFRLAT